MCRIPKIYQQAEELYKRMIETCEALASKRTAYRVDRNLIETERRETSAGRELTLRTIGLVPRARALDVHEI